MWLVRVRCFIPALDVCVVEQPKSCCTRIVVRIASDVWSLSSTASAGSTRVALLIVHVILLNSTRISEMYCTGGVAGGGVGPTHIDPLEKSDHITHGDVAP